MSSILIKNGIIATLNQDNNENQILENYSLSIKNQKIEKIDIQANFIEKDYDTIIDAKNKIVMPALINAHTHFYSTFSRGLMKAKPSKNFTELLTNLWWRLDKQLTLEDSYYSALVAIIDAIKHGVSTVIDHHASPFSIKKSLFKIEKAVLQSKIRASLCYELSNRDGNEIANQGINENIDFISHLASNPSPNLSALFGMHASFTIEDSTMQKAVDLAEKYNAGFHIHTAEDISDQQITFEKTNKTVVERLNDFGILKPNTLLPHGIHLSDKELDLIKQNDSILVHNAQSNMNNAVGSADIVKWQKRGILFGLGTDAMTNNMFEEMRIALWNQKLFQKDPSVGFNEVTQALFVNNAKIVNRIFSQENSIQTGQLKEGFQADVILVDYISPTVLTNENFLGHVVFGISQSTVDTNIINGEIVMLNKKLLTLDEKTIHQEALLLSKKLWNRF